jgi:lipid-binding SYLF domain-containing protein
MKAFTQFRTYILCLLFTLPLGSALADEDAAKYSSALKTFQDAGESGSFFGESYGYALFPSVGKAGLGVGGAYGKGRVYASGKWVGDTSMSQLSIGWQAGGQAYSQVIFFEDKRSFDEFTGGNFEFSADASAVAVTAGVSGSAGSTGSSAGASAGKSDASTAGAYRKGMATFTVAKGGLMYEAALAGQKFKYTAK